MSSRKYVERLLAAQKQMSGIGAIALREALGPRPRNGWPRR
jgi:hypothetical protein